MSFGFELNVFSSFVRFTPNLSTSESETLFEIDFGFLFQSGWKKKSQ